MEFFKGAVSNYKKDVLSTTTGSYEELLYPKKSKRKVAGKVSSKIQTEHKHYLNFSVGRVAFRLEGDYVFDNDDLVAVWAKNSGKGYYNVVFFKNFSREFGVLPERGSLFVEKVRAIFGGIMLSIVSFVVLLILFALLVKNPQDFHGALILLISLIVGILRIHFGFKYAPENVKIQNSICDAIEYAFSPEELQEAHKQD